jgi:glucosamine-6-phosphate deaminase
MMTDNFSYKPSQWVPFRDKTVLERVKRIKKEDIAKHPNPDFRIKVVRDSDVEALWITDLFFRIKESADQNRRVVLILPNPAFTYRKVALLINRFRVSCRNVFVFIMDEYADQDGRVAPESWPQGFMHQFKKYFYQEIDSDLRPPESQICGPTTENIGSYGKMIADLGGADACYSGSGWTGHLAFIEPDAPEFDAALEEWTQLGPRIVTLSPFTIAQNSLHGSFGRSGDLALIPPKAFTIGPAEVIASKYRMDMNALTIAGTGVSWQRLITRLVAHGPVTPKVPSSLLQTLPTDFFIADSIAEDIAPDWTMAY